MKNSKKKTSSKVEYHASVESINVSIQKINEVARNIRSRPIKDASDYLNFSRKRVSYVFLKLLNSAIANAENNFGADRSELSVSRVELGRKKYLKRRNIQGRGRSGAIFKPYSSIKIFLSKN